MIEPFKVLNTSPERASEKERTRRDSSLNGTLMYPKSGRVYVKILSKNALTTETDGLLESSFIESKSRR